MRKSKEPLPIIQDVFYDKSNLLTGITNKHDLEAIKIFIKYFQISAEKNFAMESEEYFLFLKPKDGAYNLTCANITKNEYEILEEWLDDY